MHAQPRTTDCRSGAEDLGLTTEDLALLRLISEQVAIPVDQLARFLDRSIDEVRLIVGKLERECCVASDQLVVGDHRWVWLRNRGARLVGRGNREPRRPPSVSKLAHRRAVNEVRLHLEGGTPDGRWISENELLKGTRHPKRCPNAVFEVEGEKHAIHVALNYMQKSRPRGAIANSSERYDKVVYFCGPRTQTLLKTIKDTENWPKLVVREVPNNDPEPRRPSIRQLPIRQPSDAELETLRLMSEQGAIPTDQLGRFLERRGKASEGFLETFVDASYATRDRLIVGEPEWIWLTERGARLSGSGLRLLRPRSGGLPKLRALNEARLLIEETFPTAHWTGRRMLLQEKGNYAQVPAGVVELEGMRHSVDVKLNRHNKEHWVPLIAERCKSYDAVLILCAEPKIRAFMEALQNEHGWQKVVVRNLPSQPAAS